MVFCRSHVNKKTTQFVSLQYSYIVTFFPSGFSFTNIHDLQDSREKGRVSLHRQLDIGQEITAEAHLCT